jgi:hypothetical protein
MRRVILISVLLVCAYSSMAQSIVYGYDLRGQPVTQLADRRAAATGRPIVLFFVATDCPISSRYVPEIQRLAKQFAANHATFWLIYPNATETADGVMRHNSDFGLDKVISEDHVLLRPQPGLMVLAPATITPEAAVLMTRDSTESTLHTVYLGRIDDRYIDIGRERPQATRHDLEQAIEAALHRQPVAPPGGRPVGCGIVTEAALQSGAGKP